MHFKKKRYHSYANWQETFYHYLTDQNTIVLKFQIKGIGCGFEKGGETPQKLKGNVRKRSHKLRKTERQGEWTTGREPC